ncbi:hypothetical protein M422DRAFT_255961 [Sphaerobolus stellatus SS14]|uniref:Uncharacterized protein n=1 Tax=Sphaerobolus stellatus (strain SS14) TaxID=990650 RepID=A0A0C9VI41_SPHS4|nr:hypothetical protein M422DRAFT_255961 [Sphaerobolus stellatus SS14]
MRVTRSSGPQGPSVTVLLGLIRVKKSSLRYEKEFPRILRRRKTEPGVVAPSEAIERPKKTLSTPSKSNTRIQGRTSRSTSDESKKVVAKRGVRLLHEENALYVEEHRVFCAECHDWVKLSDIYDIEDWFNHSQVCKGPHPEVSKSTVKPPMPIKKSQPVAHKPAPKPMARPIKRSSKALTVMQPLRPRKTNVRGRSESERAKFLEKDARIAVAEPRRVLCKMCGLWIKLRNTTTYCSTPWLVHAERCEKRPKGGSEVEVRASASRESTPSGFLSSSPESES